MTKKTSTKIASTPDNKEEITADQSVATMPRTTLRYVMEHFDKKQRDHYLSLKKGRSGL